MKLTRLAFTASACAALALPAASTAASASGGPAHHSAPAASRILPHTVPAILVTTQKRRDFDSGLCVKGSSVCADTLLWQQGDPVTVTTNFSTVHFQRWGTVSSSGGWPFDIGGGNGGGWNTRYSGNDAYVLEEPSNHSNCFQQATTASPFYVQENNGSSNCQGGAGKGVVWVRSGDWLISVQGTDRLGKNNGQTPVIMQAGCINSGCKVYTSTNTANSHWAF